MCGLCVALCESAHMRVWVDESRFGLADMAMAHRRMGAARHLGKMVSVIEEQPLQ